MMRLLGAVAGAVIVHKLGRAYGQHLADQLAMQIAERLAAPQPQPRRWDRGRISRWRWHCSACWPQ